MKVLVSDNFSPEGLQVFTEAGGIEVAYLPGITAERLLKEVVDADALVVRGGTQVTAEVFRAGKKLKIVGRAGIGVDNMDLAAANLKGVVIMNTPFGSTTTMAEYTIAMLMALAKRIPEANIATKAGQWDMHSFSGIDIAGKTLGVIGAGKIGRLVIERAAALRMQTIVFDPYLANSTIKGLGAEPASMEQLLERSDFITLHIPLNWETEHILNRERLKRVKPGCRIVNCAMGGLIDETALAQEIQSGRIAGAALDVFTKEPPEPTNPLLGMDQVVCTPHLRAATDEAQHNVTVQTARQVIDFLKKGVIANAINVPSVSAELLPKIKPFATLAERLGSFQAQLYGRGIKEVAIDYSGSVTSTPTSPLTMALVKGLLTPMTGSMVNYINAPHLAQERGIRIFETRSSTCEGFSNMIRLTVKGAQGEHSLCGVLFGSNDFRLVQVDRHSIEIHPDGHMLAIYHDGHPELFDSLRKVLTETGLTIDRMSFSRPSLFGTGLAIIQLDAPATEPVLHRLREDDHIKEVTPISI